MFKHKLGLLLSTLIITLSSHAYGDQTDFITYEWLTEGDQSIYHDHLPHWKRLFNTTKVRGFIECGCGFASKYFMEHTDKVVSIEYINSGYDNSKYLAFVEIYKDQANWIPVLYNADMRSNSFNNACAHQCATHLDYALVDAAYVRELYQHFKKIIVKAQSENYDIDAAFVNPGMFLRGDLVKLLLAHKIPIVAAHGTSSDQGAEEKANLYGWNKVTTPANYEKIYIPFGQGTTFWVSDQLPDLIASLQEYRDNIIKLTDLGYGISFDDIKQIANEVP